MVFKNCARQEKPKVRAHICEVAAHSHRLQEREFVNDSLRTDFHRKFMSKYIR